MSATVMASVAARAGGGHGFGSGGGTSSGLGRSGFGLGRGHSFFFFGGGGGGGGSVLAVILILVLALLVLSMVGRRRRWGRRDTGSASGGWRGPGRQADPGAPPAPGGSVSAPPAGEPSPAGWSHGDEPAIESLPADLFGGRAAPGRPVADAGGGVAGGLAAIKRHDPGFEQEAFLEQVQRVFFIVQEAWSKRQPDLSRRVMADGLWQQHRAQIDGYVQAGKRNVLEDLAVGQLTIMSATTDAAQDIIVVRVLAACADYDVDDATGRIVRGDRRVGNWQEDWTFERSSEATTPAGGGTFSSKCPNCGAPLDLDLEGVCRYCHAPVMSGRYDWVLARIAQITYA